MKISAVKLYENGFMSQPFAFGGEEGAQNFDPTVKYRSSLQNYVIDTGKEVILVDTGMPDETPQAVADPNAPIYMGKKICDYISALKNAGYAPEQVSKILITHKHADHTGELRRFKNAEIYCSPTEAEADELKPYPNVIRTEFNDGPFKNFPACRIIAENVYYIPAKGHTNGNCIVIVKDGDIYYMIHGDITYTDEALYKNKLSVVYEDIAAARDTLNKVREFIKNNKTVYLSTHTPLGCENLENKKIVDLDDMPAPIPPKEVAEEKGTGKYVCSVCGFVYDPEHGDATQGIAPGTAFEDLPENWKCPRCKQNKGKFNKA